MARIHKSRGAFEALVILAFLGLLVWGISVPDVPATGLQAAVTPPPRPPTRGAGAFCIDSQLYNEITIQTAPENTMMVSGGEMGSEPYGPWQWSGASMVLWEWNELLNELQLFCTIEITPPPPGIVVTPVETDDEGDITAVEITGTLEQGETSIPLPPNDIVGASGIRTLRLTMLERIAGIQILLSQETPNAEPLEGVLEFGQVVVGAFDADHNLGDAVAVAIFQLDIDEETLQEAEVDPKTLKLVRTFDGQQQVVTPSAINGVYTATFSGLSLFSVVATSPPLRCSVCETGEWSGCVGEEESRLTNVCNDQTGYTCRPVVETRPCFIAATQVPELPLETFIPAVIAILVGIVLLVRARKRKKSA